MRDAGGSLANARLRVRHCPLLHHPRSQKQWQRGQFRTCAPALSLKWPRSRVSGCREALNPLNPQSGATIIPPAPLHGAWIPWEPALWLDCRRQTPGIFDPVHLGAPPSTSRLYASHLGRPQEAGRLHTLNPTPYTSHPTPYTLRFHPISQNPAS